MEKSGTKAGIQKFGAYLSGMVMPNISAFIAWGLITALFIETGWLPNEKLAAMVGPMITYLLPLLIAYTGGKMVYDHRGGVVGATAAMGLISLGLEPKHLARAIAALLLYVNEEDPEAMVLQKDLKELGLSEVLKKYAGLSEEDSLAKLIKNEYILLTD